MKVLDSGAAAVLFRHASGNVLCALANLRGIERGKRGYKVVYAESADRHRAGADACRNTALSPKRLVAEKRHLHLSHVLPYSLYTLDFLV